MKIIRSNSARYILQKKRSDNGMSTFGQNFKNGMVKGKWVSEIEDESILARVSEAFDKYVRKYLKLEVYVPTIQM